MKTLDKHDTSVSLVFYELARTWLYYECKVKDFNGITFIEVYTINDIYVLRPSKKDNVSEMLLTYMYYEKLFLPFLNYNDFLSIKYQS